MEIEQNIQSGCLCLQITNVIFPYVSWVMLHNHIRNLWPLILFPYVRWVMLHNHIRNLWLLILVPYVRWVMLQNPIRNLWLLPPGSFTPVYDGCTQLSRCSEKVLCLLRSVQKQMHKARFSLWFMIANIATYTNWWLSGKWTYLHICEF